MTVRVSHPRLSPLFWLALALLALAGFLLGGADIHLNEHRSRPPDQP